MIHLCENCFPDWMNVEVLTLPPTFLPCEQCGTKTITRNTFRTDPRKLAHEEIERLRYALDYCLRERIAISGDKFLQRDTPPVAGGGGWNDIDGFPFYIEHVMKKALSRVSSRSEKAPMPKASL